MAQQLDLKKAFAPPIKYLARPLTLFRGYDAGNLRPDLLAGITVAVIALPQAIAFALIAQLPPQMGLYALIVASIVGALWGSSNQAHTGPANAISLLVFGSLASLAAIDEGERLLAAGMLAVLVGLFQLALGLGRLGVLVNFVSHSVIVGFSTGAGVLIALQQLRPIFRVPAEGDSIIVRLWDLIQNLPETHLPSFAIGGGAILLLLVMRRLNPKLPADLIALILASLAVFLFNLDQHGVDSIGSLPRSLPPLANLNQLDFDIIQKLLAGTIAVGSIGLVQTAAVSRSMATQTRQKLDSNQEFVGQGLANIAAGFFSGYPGAGSFARSAVNFRAGAKSPMAAIFSSLFVIIIMLLFAPMAIYLPTAALAGILIVTAVGMIDLAEIKRIFAGAPGDAAIMVVTFLGTLFLNLEYAVLLGILLSFFLFVKKTSAPRLLFVTPDLKFQHLTPIDDEERCPQLSILDIQGDLYFGAVSAIEETIHDHLERHPDERFLLARLHSVNQVDFSGIHALESIVKMYRDRGGDLFFMRAHGDVHEVMERTQFVDFMQPQNFLEEGYAIEYLFYHILDPAVCIYECPVKIFRECQNLPKHQLATGAGLNAAYLNQTVQHISAKKLHDWLSQEERERPAVIDIREESEYRHGHIPQAESHPLTKLLSGEPLKMPANQPIVLVCRTGRRSRRAATLLKEQPFANVSILNGGLLAWKSAHYLEAVDYSTP